MQKTDIDFTLKSVLLMHSKTSAGVRDCSRKTRKESLVADVPDSLPLMNGRQGREGKHPTDQHLDFKGI